MSLRTDLIHEAAECLNHAEVMADAVQLHNACYPNDAQTSELRFALEHLVTEASIISDLIYDLPRSDTTFQGATMLSLYDIAAEYQAEIDKDPTFAVAHSKYSDLAFELTGERSPWALTIHADTCAECLLTREDLEDEAKDLAAADIGGLTLSNWPLRHIDWDAATDELAEDYLRIDYDGCTYYIHY